MVKNMGSVDRVLRTILAIGFIIVSFVFGGWLWILGALGVVFLVTAATSSCPLYIPFGLSTRGKQAE